MKELSIEEKAKAYDITLDKIKMLLGTGSSCSREELEYVFPELRESEDERIRKALVKLVKKAGEGYENISEGISIQKAIDWLEKQGEQKPMEEHDFIKIASGSYALSFIDYLDAHKYKGKMCVSNGECEDIENAFHNAMWDKLHRYYCKYIEKQGEQKSTNNQFTPEQAGILDKHIDKFLEQKPANKTEPKFKVGDIVKHKNNPHLTYILKRFTDDGDYEFHAIGKDGNEGCTCFSVVKYQDEWELVEQKSAEWSIFDYRTWQYIVSDVLTKKDGIGQYLDSGECKKIAKYMQEEWSKKLSVEQRTTELPKGKDYGIDGLYAAIDILTKTLGKVDGYQSDDGILEHKCAISAVKNLYEQKPAWSEEDEINRDLVYNALNQVYDMTRNKKLSNWINNRISYSKQQEWSEKDEEMIEALNMYVKQLDVMFSEIKIGDKDILAKDFRENVQNWLKSLKYKVLPQSKQEWSKEDEKCFNILISIINNPSSDGVFDYHQINKSAFNHWVKSLKDRVQPKLAAWSEEDRIHLGNCIALIQRLSDSEANWLKSLKDRYTWKPSDEQMGVMEAVINNKSFQRRHLDSLYEQLKKLKEK